MPSQTIPALTSRADLEENTLARKKYTSAKRTAANQKSIVKAVAKSVEVRQAKARVRKMNQAKLMEAEKQFYFARARDLSRAALIPALGATFMYRLDPLSKKAVLVKDPIEIGTALDLIHDENKKGYGEGKYYFVTTEQPDIKAIVAIWDRMFGKAAESKTVDVNIKQFSLVSIARERQTLPVHESIDEVALLPEAREVHEVKE